MTCTKSVEKRKQVWLELLIPWMRSSADGPDENGTAVRSSGLLRKLVLRNVRRPRGAGGAVFDGADTQLEALVEQLLASEHSDHTDRQRRRLEAEAAVALAVGSKAVAERDVELVLRPSDREHEAQDPVLLDDGDLPDLARLQRRPVEQESRLLVLLTGGLATP